MDRKSKQVSAVDTLPIVGSARAMQARHARVTNEKERSLAREAEAKTLESYASTAQKVLPMLAMLYGLSVSFEYFFLAINFFPSGLSVGDTLLYVFIAFGYGALSILFIAAGQLVMLPVLAFDDGARSQGMPDKAMAGRFVWAAVSIFSPFLLSSLTALGWIAYGPIANQYAKYILLGLMLVATGMGIWIHRQAWRLGAGRDVKRIDGVETWLSLGMANGLVFQGLYSIVLLVYGTTAIVTIGVSIFSGIVAWVTLGLLKSSDADPAISPSRFTVSWPLRNLPLALSVSFLAINGVLLSFEYSKCAEARFFLAIAGFLLYIGAIATNPKVIPAKPNDAAEEPSAPPTQGRPRPEAFAPRARLLPMLAMVAFSIPLIADMWYMEQRLSIAVFRGLGLRVEDTTVRLKGEALSLLKAQTNIASSNLSFCFEPDGSAIVAPVTVLWHGLGERSLIAFGAAITDPNNKGRTRMPRVEVASTEVKVLGNQASQCRDLKQEVHYASREVSPSVAQQEALIKEVASVFHDIYPSGSEPAESRWALDKVIVTGFADPMPLSDGGNEELARQRAACLAVKIFDQIQLRGPRPSESDVLRWVGEGARAPVRTTCPFTGSQEDLAECHAANRLARVRIIVSCKDEMGAPSTACLFAKSGNVLKEPGEKTVKAPTSVEYAASAAAYAASVAADCAGRSAARRSAIHQ